MALMYLVPLEVISGQNALFTGQSSDSGRLKALAGIYSSFYYYKSLEERIGSIIRSLLKDHFFIDGNKRTALFTYIMLAKINGLDFIEDADKQVELMIELAEGHKSVKEFSRLLFPN